MIKLKASGQEFSVPQSWEEVTVCQFHKLAKTTAFPEMVSILTGLSLEQVNAFGESFIMQVTPFLMWLSQPVDPTSWPLPEKLNVGRKEYQVTKDIRLHTWGQKTWLQQEMRSAQGKDGHLNACMPMAIAIYAQPEVQGAKFNYDAAAKLVPLIEQEKFCKVYPVAKFFFEQLEAIADNEQKTLDSKYTTEQTRAGISMFNELGVFNTIDSLAGGDPLKYDEVMLLPYNTVYMKMRKSKLESVYSQNMSNILNKKK